LNQQPLLFLSENLYRQGSWLALGGAWVLAVPLEGISEPLSPRGDLPPSITGTIVRLAHCPRSSGAFVRGRQRVSCPTAKKPLLIQGRVHCSGLTDHAHGLGMKVWACSAASSW